MRRKLVVGNWKMHGSKAGIAELLTRVQRELPPLQGTDVGVCPPFVYLSWAQQHLVDGPIGLGAQNICAEPVGAYTGEIAASMLRDCGCRYVIVGHSERRHLFAEDNALVASKAAIAIQHGLTPIICVGESLAERDADTTLDVIGAQLDAVLAVLSEEDLTQTVVAYEPVWAIGTGRTATPAQAQAVHAFIRQRLAAAGTVRIIYGGSVKADNAAELFAQPDIDGGLVGGASLNAEEFVAICKAAE
jgi:triosephosphate isomerase (TIM)